MRDIGHVCSEECQLGSTLGATGRDFAPLLGPENGVLGNNRILASFGANNGFQNTQNREGGLTSVPYYCSHVTGIALLSPPWWPLQLADTPNVVTSAVPAPTVAASAAASDAAIMLLPLRTNTLHKSRYVN